MSAVDAMFEGCRRAGRAAFIPYLTAGDPDLETSGELLYALVEGGADLIELGIPFSDPIADGPVNQRSAARALAAGARLSGILDLVARHRERLGVPVVLFSYFNPILARGLEAFADQAASSGVDGVLCLDLPPEEAGEDFLPILRSRGLDTVFLLAPTSTRQRVREVAAASTGFVYYVSRTGVTGTRDRLAPELLREAQKLRKRLQQPLAVGFGISTPEQVGAVGRVADGVVVGSALVKMVEERSGLSDLARALEDEVRSLSAPLREGRRRR